MSQPRINHIGIIGAGAWGTALALAAHRAGRVVTLYARDAKVAALINAKRENMAHLPGIDLPQEINVTNDMLMSGKTDALLLAIPAQELRPTLQKIVPIAPPQPVVICAKGIERGTLRLMPEVAAEISPNHPCALLSGPSFAREVALDLPTTITVAAAKMQLAQELQQALASRSFRPYACDDLVGTAIGGAIKNVLAIACGITTGLGLGENTRAAIITRGFAEMARFCAALGGRPETLMGLSGFGDLILTATSPTSRNYALGFKLGEGALPDQISNSHPALAEGTFTSAAAAELAARHGIDMPIISTVAAVLAQRLTITDAINLLLDRPLRPEQ